jgi:two-component system, NarL family, sensor histidine kinase UhpB
MRKPTSILLLSFLIFYGQTSAQKINVDSVKNELVKSKEDTGKVILYRILAGTLRLSDPSSAIEYGKQGAALGKKLNFDKGTAGCYLNIAVNYSTLGKLDSGLSFIDTAIYYSHKAGDPSRLALAYLNRADFYMQLQNFDQSLKNCDTSLKYAEQANSDDRRARVLQTIGSVYLFQKLYEQSAEYYNKANVLYRKINNLQMSAIVLNNLALVYKNTDDYKKAAEVLQQAITIADSLNDLSNLSLYHGTLSDVYFNTGNYSLAEKYANTSMQYAKQMKNDISIGNAWEYLGQIYLKQKKTAEAISALTNGYTIFKKLGDNDKINTTSGILAEAYASAGNYAKAYDFLNISRQANDTLVKHRFDEDIAAMQTRFKVDEKDKEILLLDKNSQLQAQKIKQQRFLIFMSITVAVLVLLGIGMAVSRYRLRNRMKELELRNRIAADLHDEVGSSLSSIHMLSQIATQKQNTDASQAEILARMSNNAKETMDKMGDIVWMIKPGESEGTNLKQRMERFAHEICSSREIATEINLEELEKTKLSMVQRKNIYLIFKEALNNAAKYSGAEKIIINVSAHNRQLKMIISDNGKGFEPVSTGKGNGLDNMQNRAKDLGGDLNIESGNGTSIILTVPV